MQANNTPRSRPNDPAHAASAHTLLLGDGQAMQRICQLVLRIANLPTSVLLTGPSGSGKERVARAIHVESDRRARPFVAINCGAIPRDLLESELFGHEKGSFTGATATKIGRFEAAHRGTLFLDEIGDMPSDMQVKLLRVLEERRVERVGGSASIPIDVRVISATHRDLTTAIAGGHFREDLYYRLAVFPIELPPLSERLEDLPILIKHFQDSISAVCEPVSFDAGAMRAMMAHPWPGNIRELRNFVERIGILHSGEQVDAGVIDAMLLRAKPVCERPTMTPTIMPATREIEPGGINLRAILSDLESRYISEALSRTNGVVADAARLLGLQRTTLIEKMRRHAA